MSSESLLALKSAIQYQESQGINAAKEIYSSPLGVASEEWAVPNNVGSSQPRVSVSFPGP
jgi:hypothetical protein